MPAENFQPNNAPREQTNEERLASLLERARALETERERIEAELEKDNKIGALTPVEFGQSMDQVIDMTEKKQELTTDSNRLREEMRYPIEKREGNGRNGKTETKNGEASPVSVDRTGKEMLKPKERVEQFIKQYNLEAQLPPGFEKLTDDQKLYVMRNMEKRIVDIVYSDAETQYSDYLRQKMTNGNLELGKIGNALQKTKKSVEEGVKKEFELSRLRNEAFTELNNTPEGKKLIAQDLAIIAESAKNQNIKYYAADDDFFITYIDDPKEKGAGYMPEERMAILEYNFAANEFRRMPYEWGQEGKAVFGGHRRKYEKVKKEYERAKGRIMNMQVAKGKPEKQAMLDMAGLDSTLEMEQLLNTHPEFEKELAAIEAGNKDGWEKTKGNIVTSLKGKDWTNRMLLAGGFLARKTVHGAKFASNSNLQTLIATAAVGATVGSVRGGFKAMDTLKDRQKKARYGKEDENKERAAVMDVTYLDKRLSDLMEKVENPSNPAEKGRNLALLSVRIDHTVGKMKKGEVNLGDKKVMLANKAHLSDTLSKAMVLRAMSGDAMEKELEEKINGLLFYAGKGAKNIRDEREAKFIRKQMWKGAKNGAGLAVLGYLIREIWWDDHPAPANHTPEVQPVPVVPQKPTIELVQPPDTTVPVVPHEHVVQHINPVPRQHLPRVEKPATEHLSQHIIEKKVPTSTEPVYTTTETQFKMGGVKGGEPYKFHTPEPLHNPGVEIKQGPGIRLDGGINNRRPILPAVNRPISGPNTILRDIWRIFKRRKH